MNIRLMVEYKYLDNTTFREDGTISELLNGLAMAREIFLNTWVDSDDIYNPLKMVEITKLSLNKYGDVTFLQVKETGKNGR